MSPEPRRIRVVWLRVQFLPRVLKGAPRLRVRRRHRVRLAALPGGGVLHDFVHHLLQLLTVRRLEVAGGAADWSQLVLLGRVGVALAVLVVL